MSNASKLMSLGMSASLANEVTKQIASGSGGGVTPQPAPTITIDDPVSQDVVQQAFDNLVNALRSAGVLT